MGGLEGWEEAMNDASYHVNETRPRDHSDLRA